MRKSWRYENTSPVVATKVRRMKVAGSRWESRKQGYHSTWGKANAKKDVAKIKLRHSQESWVD